MNTLERFMATYRFEPVDHLPRFGESIWIETEERWKNEGLDPGWLYNEKSMPMYECEGNRFHVDPPLPTVSQCVDLGGLHIPFHPVYESKLISREGDTETWQDRNGSTLRGRVGRTHGWMPTYLRSCVERREDWPDAGRRLDPESPERWEGFEERIAESARRVSSGEAILYGGAIGGYMYLRTLFGPINLLYVFHDDPELIHECMAAWRTLLLASLKRVQRHVPFTAFNLCEDICYKSGPLISPQMVRDFLGPYYREVVEELRAGQRERIWFQIDTDGFHDPLLPVYQEIGVDALWPFEVAAGCDVVRTAREYPDLVIQGGIDKRALAVGPDAIDRELERRILPMLERGGYIPTIDHLVPHDVPLSHYQYYRDRIIEMDH